MPSSRRGPRSRDRTPAGPTTAVAVVGLDGLDTALGIATARISLDGTLIGVAPEFAAMFDEVPEHLVGRRLSSLGSSVRQVLEGSEVTLHTVASRERGIRTIEVRGVVDSGDPDTIIACARDVTTGQRATDRLARASRLARVGHWQWDIGRQVVDASDEVYDIFDIPKGRSLSPRGWLDRLHPDDLSEVTGAIEAHRKEPAPFDVTFRIVGPDRSVRWITASAEVLTGAEGRPIALEGVVQDITSIRTATTLAEATAAELNALVESSPAAILRFDAVEGLYPISYANRRALEALGGDRQAVVGRTGREIGLGDALSDRWRGLLERVFAGEPQHDLVHLDLADGPHWFDVQIAPVYIEGRVAHALASALDVSETRRTIQRLEQAEALARVASWHIDLQSGTSEVSEGFIAMLGYAPASARGDAEELLRRFTDDRDIELARRELAMVVELGEATRYEVRLRRADGGVVRAVVAAAPVLGPLGSVIGISGALVDVTDIRVRDEQLRALVENTPDPVLMFDRFLRVTALNDAAVRGSGVTREEALGTNVGEFGDGADWWRVHLQHVIETGEPRSFEYEHDALGTTTCYEATAAPRFGSDGTVSHVIVAARDVTARKRAEDEVAHRVLHDELTGLLNRQGARVEVERAVERRDRVGRRIAVLSIGLDRLSLVNDSLGHERGDELLVQVARRLESVLPPTATLARIGGDEFALVLEDVEDEADTARLARTVLEVVREPLALGGRSVSPTASIGIVTSDADDDAAPDALLSKSDAALLLAKEQGRDRYAFSGAATDARIAERLEIELELHGALAADQLDVHFQPIVDARSDALVGAEALLRWKHPTRGLLSAGEFVAIAEEAGLIVEIGDWVLDRVSSFVAEWRRDFGDVLPVSVNLAAAQLREPGLAARLCDIVERHGVRPADLVLEVVESTLVTDTAAARSNLRELAMDRGFEFAIDDFGTGYSSLSYLKSLPAGILKIDRSFVAGLPGEAEDDAIVSSIVALAKSFGLRTTAEGVETPAQARRLRELGVDALQGYLFGRPMEAHDLRRMGGSIDRHTTGAER